MTISRTPDSLHGAVQAAIDWAGPEAAARAAGVTPARLRQVSNPNRRDADLAYVLVGIDAASARGGGGTPVFDWYMDQLSRAGSFGLSSQAARGPAPAVTRVLASRVIAGVRALLAELEDLIAPPSAALARAG